MLRQIVIDFPEVIPLGKCGCKHVDNFFIVALPYINVITFTVSVQEECV
jgi:hypothetical protein